ncbi:MAG: DUF4468 domain-containing protein, partial [Cryomorphaceae bacterium]
HNMRYLFILLLTSLSFQSLSQIPLDENGAANFSDVIELSESTQEALFKRAKLWLVSTLKSGDSMVELNEKGLDQLVGTGNIYLDEIELGGRVLTQNKLNFKFIIYCKEGRYKYEVNNFTFHYTLRMGNITEVGTTNLEELTPHRYLFKQKHIDEYKKSVTEQTITRISELIESLKNTMATNQGDW